MRLFPQQIFFTSLIVLIAGILQGAPIFDLFGIKPNLVSILLLVISIFINSFWQYLFLVFLSIIALKFNFGLEIEVLVIPALSTIAFFVHRHSPWSRTFTIFIYLVVASFIFYFIIDKQFLSQHLLIVIVEIIYNFSLAMLIFLGFKRVLA